MYDFEGPAKIGDLVFKDFRSLPFDASSFNVCCSELQCGAVCFSVLQCAAVCWRPSILRSLP